MHKWRCLRIVKEWHGEASMHKPQKVEASLPIHHSYLSASSRMCVLAPLSTMVQASPKATPEKWSSLSSPIMISSISLHVPSFT